MVEEAKTRDEYDLASVKLPRLSGFSLRFLAGLMESPFSFLVQSSLLDKSGISAFRRQYPEEAPTYYPAHPVDAGADIDDPLSPGKPALPPKDRGKGFRFNTVQDYSTLYSGGKATPADVAGKLIDAVTESEKGDRPLRAFIAVQPDDIIRQAEDSAERFRQGKPLGILDGVPVSIKDQLHVKGFPTTVGTSFLGTSPAREDATVVERLRKAGAVIIGKTNMQELGMGVTGFNPHHGVTRNPYNPAHYTGGSSSGPATAVAAGLGAASIGADGGGSIRIPASLCGLVGLKPTFGRVSTHGDIPLCPSVDHLGPIAATAADAAIIYSAIAGPDPKDPLSLAQPSPAPFDHENTDLGGLTLGIYPEWFNHADADIVSVCESLVSEMKNMGANVREITIPGLETARVAHTVTIASEIAGSVERYYKEHRKECGLDLRLNLAMARKFTSLDYLKAQQVRTRMLAEFKRVLGEVDVIITPTSGIAAPPIPEKTLPGGESNLTELFEIMRFMTYANLTGLPAISFPAGYTGQGLPVGMQAIGRPWQENTLLRLAAAAETVVERKSPAVYYDLLKDFR